MDDKIQSADFDGLMFPIEFGYETVKDGYVIYSPYGNKLPPYKIVKLLNDAYKLTFEAIETKEWERIE